MGSTQSTWDSSKSPPVTETLLKMNLKFIFAAALAACASAQGLQKCKDVQDYVVTDTAKWPVKTEFDFDALKAKIAGENKAKFAGMTDAKLLQFKDLAGKFDADLVARFAAMKAAKGQ